MNAFKLALTQLTPILMAEGSQGRCVVNLQKVLRLTGAYTGFVDGIFGAQTRAAIEALQYYFGLSVTGIFDSNLWYALSVECTEADLASAELKAIALDYAEGALCSIAA